MKKHIEIHMLQYIPVNAVNCGGDGEVKMIGDRQRVSSQAWKRPIRLELNKGLENKTIHTRDLESILSELEGASPENVAKTLKLVASLSGNNSKDVMAKWSTLEIEYLKNLTVSGDFKNYFDAKENKENKALIADLNNLATSFGINLFGRMFANARDLDVYASAKFSHSFSVHTSETEIDYFSAADDLNNNGAGHIGDKSFTSSVQYRYASIDYNQLIKNYGTAEINREALSEAIREIVYAFPSGRENAMYSRTRPDYIRISLRNNNHPMCAASAFESPVKNKGNGFMEPSVQRIEQFFDDCNGMYGDEYLVVAKVGKEMSLNRAIDIVMDYL